MARMLPVGQAWVKSWVKRSKFFSLQPEHVLHVVEAGRLAGEEECAFRARVSFCRAGIHATCTAAPRIRSRSAAITSTRASSPGVMVNWGA